MIATDASTLKLDKLTAGQLSKLDQLTTTGRDWLVSALDPFHDTNLHLEGLPDQCSFPSVVMMHKQEYTLTIPTSAAGGNWDAKIMYTGTHGYSDYLPNYYTVASAGGVNLYEYDHATVGAAASSAQGPFVIHAGAAGARLNVQHATGETKFAYATALTLLPSRLIGVAFEVHNTTADVYKQGSVTAAPLPWGEKDFTSCTYADTNAAPWLTKDQQLDFGPDLPTVATDLRISPQSITIEAKDGIYAIPRMEVMPNTLSPYARHRGMAWRGYGTSSVPVISGSITGTPGTVPYVYGPASSGFVPVAAYFTGLSPQTSLQIVMRSIVEYFPPTNANSYPLGPSLIPTATPSAVYDPKALVLYSRIAQVAPYAVPVTMNPAGEYFRLLMKIAASVAPAIAPFLGPFAPVAVGAGALLGTGAEIWERSAKAKKNGAKPDTIRKK